MGEGFAKMQREEELWKRLPIGSELREAAAVVCSGTHARVGCASPLRVLARVPEMVRAIMYARVRLCEFFVLSDAFKLTTSHTPVQRMHLS